MSFVPSSKENLLIILALLLSKGATSSSVLRFRVRLQLHALPEILCLSFFNLIFFSSLGLVISLIVDMLL